MSQVVYSYHDQQPLVFTLDLTDGQSFTLQMIPAGGAHVAALQFIVSSGGLAMTIPPPAGFTMTDAHGDINPVYAQSFMVIWTESYALRYNGGVVVELNHARQHRIESVAGVVQIL